jgi:hypothetical protein
VLAGTLLGALLLIVAEFTSLYRVHFANGSAVQSVSTGSHHSYAMIPIAVLAVFLGWAVRRGGGRVALLGIGAAGVVALVIALVGDLPDAHRTGITAHLQLARATPSAGLYMETLGAVILIATCGSGLLMMGRPSGGRTREQSA